MKRTRTGLKHIRAIILKAPSMEITLDMVMKLKNVDYRTSALFRHKYDPTENLSKSQAFELFYNEVKNAPAHDRK